MATLTCSDPQHATRSALQGWSASLGTGSVAITGLLCAACARRREVEATEDSTDARNFFLLKQDRSFSFARLRVYNGEVIGEKAFRQTIANAVAAGAITTVERDLFLATLVKLRDYALANPL